MGIFQLPQAAWLLVPALLAGVAATGVPWTSGKNRVWIGSTLPGLRDAGSSPPGLLYFQDRGSL